MSSDNDQTNPAFTWAGTLLPKLKSVIYRTLKAVQESQENKSNCFEVYGFDIILDELLNPWVIEANLSPACKERADWLVQLLDDMSIGLMNFLETKMLVSTDDWDDEMAEKREMTL